MYYFSNFSIRADDDLYNLKAPRLSIISLPKPKTESIVSISIVGVRTNLPINMPINTTAITKVDNSRANA